MENKSQLSEKILSDWKRVCGLLRIDFGEAVYNSWLHQMKPTDESKEVITVSVPSRFMRDWIISHYNDRIQAIWKKEVNSAQHVEIKVSSQPKEKVVMESNFKNNLDKNNNLKINESSSS